MHYEQQPQGLPVIRPFMDYPGEPHLFRLQLDDLDAPRALAMLVPVLGWTEAGPDVAMGGAVYTRTFTSTDGSTVARVHLGSNGACRLGVLSGTDSDEVRAAVAEQVRLDAEQAIRYALRQVYLTRDDMAYIQRHVVGTPEPICMETPLGTLCTAPGVYISGRWVIKPRVHVGLRSADGYPIWLEGPGISAVKEMLYHADIGTRWSWGAARPACKQAEEMAEEARRVADERARANRKKREEQEQEADDTTSEGGYSYDGYSYDGYHGHNIIRA